jgi:membrane protein YqaA with SNARE-associated domain
LILLAFRKVDSAWGLLAVIALTVFVGGILSYGLGIIEPNDKAVFRAAARRLFRLRILP